MPAFAERATVSLKLSPVSVFAVKYLYPAYGVFSTGEADLTAALPERKTNNDCYIRFQ
ncbi:hypothetical protein NRH68_002266 [Salmonella enterica]|nr:hypothetical protein [Salmonella enterica]